jgi:hypothetical protein
MTPTWKFLRWMLLPTGAIAGAILTPLALMPDPAELRRAGEMVDGTGYGSAAILGLFLGLLVAYVIRSVGDFVLDRDDAERNHNRAP